MFRDRHDAGRQLAARLMHHAGETPPPVVLGLPRGGVVVAAEIAAALDAPLDVLIVRKIGAPMQPELALGAVTDDAGSPQVVLNQDLIQATDVDEAYLHDETQRQLAEIHRRQSRYRQDRQAVPLANRTVIVVDDGIATGATMRAALTGLRQSEIKTLVLAVPVAAREALDAVTPMVDEVVCLCSPVVFAAVGRFYADFDQTSDEEVIAALNAARVNQP